MDIAQLTRKQMAFLDYILRYRKDHDVWPTYREIADAFDFKSPNSVTQNIQALIRKGALIRTRDEEYDIAPRWKQRMEPEAGAGIPIRGLIAAGYLQEAVEADLGRITLEHLFPEMDRMFALRVSGMSMKDAGIHDGDFVLLQEGMLRDGEIGAVLYNGETSLKRIFRDAKGLRLEPANEAYRDITIEPEEDEEVRIIGRYVGHMNRQGIHRVSTATSKRRADTDA
jgi:repressor LexA